MSCRSAPILDWAPRRQSCTDAGNPPALTPLSTVVGWIYGLIHTHALLPALADRHAD